MDNYDETRYRIAGEFIDKMSAYIGANLRDQYSGDRHRNAHDHQPLYRRGTAAFTATAIPRATTSWPVSRPPRRKNSSRGWSSPAPTASPATAWVPGHQRPQGRQEYLDDLKAKEAAKK
jgi:hypothetical protein